jgi:hypothetical protein
MGDASARSRADRTLIYTGGAQPDVPAGVTTGVETAQTIAGQVAVLTAVNILARTHPGLVLAVPAVPVLVPSPTGGATLVEACEQLALAANPDLHVTLNDQLPSATLGVGIGPDAGAAPIYAGGSGWTALTGTRPQAIGAASSSLLGVGMAVTLATGWIFRRALQLPAAVDRAFSLWDLVEATAPTGPNDLTPVDVGSAWLVGAGAVGSCLAWWLHFVGVEGPWTIIDGDLADVTNLNRSLGLFARDGGWEGSPPVFKAEAAAALITDATPYPHWWDDWVNTNPASPDMVLAVANDFGVRAKVAAYGHPATMNATTSRNWSAELHRHLIGTDGCISCRHREGGVAKLICATAPMPEQKAETGRDAALPFLSAASGLMLAAGVIQLQHRRWANHDRNHWSVWFDAAAASASRHSCEISCSGTPSAAARRAIHGTTRWAPLDPSAAASGAQ